MTTWSTGPKIGAEKEAWEASFHDGWPHFRRNCIRNIQQDPEDVPWDRWLPRWRTFLAGWCALADAWGLGEFVRRPDPAATVTVSVEGVKDESV
jgi:hypothetical protein